MENLLILNDFIEIDLLEIEKEKQIEANINLEVLEKYELNFNSPLSFFIDIKRKGYKFLFEGKLNTEIILPCDRCLELFNMQVTEQFKFYHILEKDLIEFIDKNFLILKDLIFGEIYLNIPFKKLCKETCKGLCINCGQNLNIKNCNCNIEINENPFKKLQAMFK